ncbi:hypothetical protein MMC22_010820 [Lobaria immixta]|nr:hypothetical protein [Lobaria immixta]
MGVSFINPDAWTDIYARKEGQPGFPKDPSRYGKWMWINGAPDIFTAGDVDHSRLRRLLIPAFSDNAIGDQEALVQLNVNLLIKQLRGRLHDSFSKGKVDMSAWLNWATFDIIGELAFGEPFGCLQAGTYHPWVSLVFENVKAVAVLQAIRQFPWVDAVVQLFLSELMARTLRNHQQLTIDKVDRRLEKREDRGDFLDIVLKHNGTEKEMTRDEIYSNSNVIIMAGSETSASAMAGCLYHLVTNPDVMSRLRDEIRSRFVSEKEITFKAVADLPYLTAVLHESMRMYPASPGYTPRVAPTGGGVVAGHFVPANKVAYAATSNFQNPKSFDPSRWLGNPFYASDRKDIFKPFVLGPRSCIAKQFAYTEMRLIITRLLWNFDIALCDESKEWTDQDVYLMWHRPALMMQLSESQKQMKA